MHLSYTSSVLPPPLRPPRSLSVTPKRAGGVPHGASCGVPCAVPTHHGKKMLGDTIPYLAEASVAVGEGARCPRGACGHNGKKCSETLFLINLFRTTVLWVIRVFSVHTSQPPPNPSPRPPRSRFLSSPHTHSPPRVAGLFNASCGGMITRAASNCCEHGSRRQGTGLAAAPGSSSCQRHCPSRHIRQRSGAWGSFWR